MSGDQSADANTPDSTDDRVIILKSDDSERSLGVRQSLLIKASKYFEGCLSFKTDSAAVSFDAKIIPFNILELIAKYIEFGELNPTSETLEHLFRAGDYLQLEAFLRVLYDYLQAELENLDPENVEKATLLLFLQIYNIVFQYESRNGLLKKDAPEQSLINTTDSKAHKCPVTIQFFVASNFNKIMTHKSLYHLDLECLMDILNSNHLNVSEVDVLKTIKMWINHDFETREKYFSKLLECVYYDDSLTLEFILDELLCSCPVDDCYCLSSKDYVIAFYAKKSSSYRTDMFPLQTFKRCPGPFKKEPFADFGREIRKISRKMVRTASGQMVNA